MTELATPSDYVKEYISKKYFVRNQKNMKSYKLQDSSLKNYFSQTVHSQKLHIAVFGWGQNKQYMSLKWFNHIGPLNPPPPFNFK